MKYIKLFLVSVVSGIMLSLNSITNVATAAVVIKAKCPDGCHYVREGNKCAYDDDGRDCKPTNFDRPSMVSARAASTQNVIGSINSANIKQRLTEAQSEDQSCLTKNGCLLAVKLVDNKIEFDFVDFEQDEETTK